MAVIFGYKAARNLVMATIKMQQERSLAGKREVLHVPILMGGVGVGKTALAQWVADELAYPLVVTNCGETSDTSDMGMPMPFFIKESGGDTFMPWVLNKQLHQACTEPVVLFFDDIDKAPSIVEGGLIGIFGARMVRDRKLHPETVIMAAGNRVEDDSLARRLSESMRTRGTIINMEARYVDFARHAKETPGAVHPAVLGFLAYRPALLHKHDPDADRFPTPRGWCEVTPYLHQYGADEDICGDKSGEAWKTFVALKCGDPAANDFNAWYQIVARVDVKRLLTTGVLEHSLTSADADAVVDYAAIFAIAQELNDKGPKKEYVGLAKYLTGLPPEHRVALLSQLSAKARNKTGTMLPDCGTIMMSPIVPLGA